MIIPVRCMTCNNMLATKWLVYQELIQKAENKTPNIISTRQDKLTEKTREAKAFEILNITRYCCKRHLLSTIDLIEES